MLRITLSIAAVCITFGAGAQSVSYNQRVQEYVSQYKELALSEQKRIGIPAAITLGQGILETQAGQSELATVANNHFGIKCKKDWTGETFAHTDDAPNECFRKYPSALLSYKDHSDYLKGNKRYNSCFACSPTDYAAWAKELRKCGYATNPRYAQQLIKIIEDFHLQEYTYTALDNKEPVLVASTSAPTEAAAMVEKKAPAEVIPEHDTPANVADSIEYGKAVKRNGVRGFYAHKDDVLLEYAIKYKMRYAKLLEINNLPDAPLSSDMFVALEKGSVVTHILSHDASERVENAGLAAPQATAQQIEKPVVSTGQINAPQNNAVTNPERAIPAEVPAMTESQPVAVPVQQQSLPVEKPVNIANEVAVEEIKPKTKEEEPKDEFSRMKARFDKVVYAKPGEKKPEVKTDIPAPEVKAATPVVAQNVPAQKQFHTVGKGETAFGICRQYNISMKELMKLNNLNFEAIKVGQKLRVK